MIDYIAESLVSVGSGRVVLTDAQADARAYGLKKVDGSLNLYEVTKIIQFKPGERFAYDGEIPKNMAVSVVRESGFREPSDDNKGTSTVNDLKKALGHGSVKETIELLASNYALDLKTGKDLIPDDVMDQLVADFDLEVTAE